MAYLNLDLDYLDHPKTKRLIGLLGRGAEMLPIRLWLYCGKYHYEDGRFIDYSPHEIESLVGWWGKSGDMIAGMLRCGFLEENDGEFSASSWCEHQGHIAALKAKGRAMANARWGKIHADSNADSNATGPPQHCSYRTTPTVPVQAKERNGARGIPTKAEAVAYGEMIGMAPADSEAFWNHFEGQNWLTKSGLPVTNWQAKQASWKVQAQQSAAQAKSGAGKPLSVHDLKTIIEAKKREATMIKNKWCSPTASGEEWMKTDEAIEQRKKHRAIWLSVRELENQLANMA